jgi:hypothetical protein
MNVTSKISSPIEARGRETMICRLETETGGSLLLQRKNSTAKKGEEIPKTVL